mmetsp:Transcript_5281/g.10520  ORF Transcript_5281/g.10520 Transcript_5281/m.10520 type:complete len:236 (-) Transcript_5281:120-827(-)
MVLSDVLEHLDGVIGRQGCERLSRVLIQLYASILHLLKALGQGFVGRITHGRGRHATRRHWRAAAPGLEAPSHRAGNVVRRVPELAMLFEDKVQELGGMLLRQARERAQRLLREREAELLGTNRHVLQLLFGDGCDSAAAAGAAAASGDIPGAAAARTPRHEPASHGAGDVLRRVAQGRDVFGDILEHLRGVIRRQGLQCLQGHLVELHACLLHPQHALSHDIATCAEGHRRQIA